MHFFLLGSYKKCLKFTLIELIAVNIWKYLIYYGNNVHIMPQNMILCYENLVLRDKIYLVLK